MRVAIVVYDGVLAAECEAFSSVLGAMDDAEVLMVGTRRGPFAGPGGRQFADARFDEVEHVDVAVVPGGIGCERAADDVQLREFLLRMERTARFVAASSTGTVVLASAGLLHGEPAVTHWLAGDLLRRYGSDADGRRLAMSGNVITCEGSISAVDAAFEIVRRVHGPVAVERIRTTLLARGAPHLRAMVWWLRPVEWARSVVGLRAADQAGTTTSTPTRVTTGTATGTATVATTDARPAPSSADEPPITPLSVMVELVDNDDLARRLKRSTRRRR
jgi:putative intracellular protease/amidase